ncbi:MAG: hypothetical protein KKH98_06030, partial [Spirochaetes bacterium]|nr:hypothetical protein [Spirochaetota bacterium]
MRYGKFFLFWSIMLLFIDLLSAQINWDGRFYEQALVSFTEEKGKVKVLYLGLSALDLKLDARPSEILRIRSEMEYAFAHQDADPFLSSEGIDAVTVNSLNATISPGNLKFTIGRFLP